MSAWQTDCIQIISVCSIEEHADMQKPIVTIENWAVVQRAVALNYQELEPGRHLMGRVFGHTTLQDSDFVYTSSILRVDADEGIVETTNTVYQLGKPSDDYKSWECDHEKSAVA
jgi:hypothetical protein